VSGDPLTIEPLPGRDELVFATADGSVLFLARGSAPALGNITDRDQAVLRALLELALQRLDAASAGSRR
jgi:hypothetical protein